MTDTPNESRCGLCGDGVDLSPTRRLELRHLVPDDGSALYDMYQRLAPEDVYRRFFTGTIPPRKWFDDWASIAERGGFGLVAEVAEGETTRIVAEAGYARLCTGDGELGIAVDPSARGWLGPWLLDALLQHADARGIPNLQALILSNNRRMARMAIARGVGSMASPDWTTSRVSMSTSGRVPSWPGDPAGDAPHERQRLLVESDRSRWAGAPEAIKAGFDVMVCRGPDGQHHGCPVLRGESCPLRDGADVVLQLLDPTSAATAELMLCDDVVHSGLRTIEGFSTDPETAVVKRRSDAELIDEVVATKDRPSSPD